MRQQRDAMVFRYKADQSLIPELDHHTQVEAVPLSVIRVLSELEFTNEFKKPPGHSYWQTIDLMQTTLKINSLSGLGKQYAFTFNAPCYREQKDRDPKPPRNQHPCAQDDFSDDELEN